MDNCITRPLFTMKVHFEIRVDWGNEAGWLKRGVLIRSNDFCGA